jgi:radical SAM protein with 4Fe4S-binding SPASM domain
MELCFRNKDASATATFTPPAGRWIVQADIAQFGSYGTNPKLSATVKIGESEVALGTIGAKTRLMKTFSWPASFEVDGTQEVSLTITSSGIANYYNSSGHGLSCVSWDGTVYPDQFWRNKPLGNVKEQSFGDIWGNPPEGSLLQQLREKPLHVTGRCKNCRFLSLCGGNFRARAEAATGELWGEDPACYLTDEEITGELLTPHCKGES